MENPGKKRAPCVQACPAGVDVPGYIRCVREGDWDGALAVIRERLPFPAVCAYACVHPCEARCARREYDTAVAVRALKRAVVRAGRRREEPIAVARTGKRVAVVGSGPCGLTAAYYLAGKGHAVTVLEAQPHPGGLLRYAVPAYRLPREVVEEEIAVILQSGVAIRTGTRVESAASLRTAGFDAVLAAPGAWRIPGTPGFEPPAALDGLSFLAAVNAGQPPPLGRQVVVVGGGNTAVDAARSALRLGASGALVLYRRAGEAMPAAPEELAWALAEGVAVECRAVPVRREGDRLVCARTVPGDREPVPLAGGEFTVPCDTLVMAVGQAADAEALGLEGNGDGTVKVDARTLATAGDGVFAAGDAVTGPSSIIQAVAQGRQAASSIDRFLGGSGFPDREGPQTRTIREPAPRGTTRQIAPSLPVAERISGFGTVEAGLSREAAMKEAVRCLSCDRRTYAVDVRASLCKGCGYCLDICRRDVLALSDCFNDAGYRPAAVVDPAKCVGCRRCLMICPDFAITVDGALI